MKSTNMIEEFYENREIFVTGGSGIHKYINAIYEIWINDFFCLQELLAKGSSKSCWDRAMSSGFTCWSGRKREWARKKGWSKSRSLGFVSVICLCLVSIGRSGIKPRDLESKLLSCSQQHMNKAQQELKRTRSTLPPEFN